MHNTPLIDFSWTPTAGLVSYSTIAGNSYPPLEDARYQAFKTPVTTLVTFSAQISLLVGAIVLYYDWDFGDGHLGRGPSITHSYPFATPEAQVSLSTVDSKGRTSYVRRMINLV